MPGMTGWIPLDRTQAPQRIPQPSVTENVLGSGVLELRAGTNVSIDNSDPQRPVVNATSSIPGPPGASSQWYVLPGIPTVDGAENDMYLQSDSGAIYKYQSDSWVNQANIMDAIWPQLASPDDNVHNIGSETNRLNRIASARAYFGNGTDSSIEIESGPDYVVYYQEHGTYGDSDYAQVLSSVDSNYSQRSVTFGISNVGERVDSNGIEFVGYHYDGFTQKASKYARLDDYAFYRLDSFEDSIDSTNITSTGIVRSLSLINGTTEYSSLTADQNYRYKWFAGSSSSMTEQLNASGYEYSLTNGTGGSSYLRWYDDAAIVGVQSAHGTIELRSDDSGLYIGTGGLNLYVPDDEFGVGDIASREWVTAQIGNGYLKLDASNGPVTGMLQVDVASGNILEVLSAGTRKAYFQADGRLGISDSSNGNAYESFSTTSASPNGYRSTTQSNIFGTPNTSVYQALSVSSAPTNAKGVYWGLTAGPSNVYDEETFYWLGFKTASTAWSERMRLTLAGNLSTTPVWNSVGTTFKARSANITDTASASGSFLDWLGVGGVEKWSIDKSGNATAAGSLRVANGANYISFSAPTLAANLAYTLPNSYGTSGYVLSTDGVGGLSWIAAGGGGSSEIWQQVDGLGNYSSVEANFDNSVGSAALLNRFGVSCLNIGGIRLMTTERPLFSLFAIDRIEGEVYVHQLKNETGANIPNNTTIYLNIALHQISNNGYTTPVTITGSCLYNAGFTWNNNALSSDGFVFKFAFATTLGSSLATYTPFAMAIKPGTGNTGIKVYKGTVQAIFRGRKAA